MKAKKESKEKITFNYHGMKKAHKKIFKALGKYNLNRLEAYIILRDTVEAIEKDAKKHDFDISQAYLDLKQQALEKAKKKEKS